METIIKYAVSNEKSIRLMEAENKLVFVVDKKANKAEIKTAIESLFKVTVTSLNTLVDRNGNKKAFVAFSPETPAIDVATDLGLI
jgi:large subunit ribosomal protein L23